MALEFRLSPPGSKRGVSCDENGAFVSAIPLLERSIAHGVDRWRPRDNAELSKQIGSHFALPIDMSSKTGGLNAIANALNEDNVARAQIATVLLAIPDPPTLSKSTLTRSDAIKFIHDLHWSGLIKRNDDENSASTPNEGSLLKAGYNPEEPRDERGRWTSGGSGDAASDINSRSPRIQLADAGMSDAVDDPIAEASTRAAAQRNFAVTHAQSKPTNNEHANFWQTEVSNISHEAQSVLSEIGSAEVSESNVNVAAARAQADAIADGLKAFANYSAKPWIGLDGQPVQIPVINTGDPNSDAGALIAHALLTPNAPLTRPGTNADWIGPLMSLVPAAAPVIRALGTGATVAAESSAVAADTPFIILPSELPPGFDARLPIGKFTPNPDLPAVPFGNDAHQQIGQMLQDAVGSNIKLMLNTALYQKGVDVEVPLDKVNLVGFQYAEIKPMTAKGYTTYNTQIPKWKLSAPVQVIAYDKQGNIYYGFVGPW